MAGTFTITVNMPTYSGSNAKDSEAQDLRFALLQIAQDVGSGIPSRPVRGRDGSNIGSYTYGVGMVNAGR